MDPPSAEISVDTGHGRRGQIAGCHRLPSAAVLIGVLMDPPSAEISVDTGHGRRGRIAGCNSLLSLLAF